MSQPDDRYSAVFGDDDAAVTLQRNLSFCKWWEYANIRMVIHSFPDLPAAEGVRRRAGTHKQVRVDRDLEVQTTGTRRQRDVHDAARET